ncbi:SLATT domain-containing protein [Isoptericola sp. NPDC056605]|uniref:SLATT domain-containing protein n=1 Tax=Isoptericola sp. NPDC056605 TaxID=3345876 RepID=UPI00369DC9FE
MTDEDAATAGPDRYLLAQVRESFGRVAYTHKTHEKQADICFAKHRLQQGVLIALTAISSGTFLVAVMSHFASTTVTSFVTSTVAVLVTWVTLGAKTFRFHEEAETHRDSAARLWDVRESYISLIADLMSGEISDADARARRDELQEAAREIYSGAPRTSSKAYYRAQDKLKNNEELTFSSRELDLLLPAALRLNESEAGR